MPAATHVFACNTLHETSGQIDMRALHKDVWLGIGTILFGALLLLVAIPNFISAPSNVSKLVLSPLLWPTIVAWLIILFGAMLIASQVLARTEMETPSSADAYLFETPAGKMHAWMRIGAVAVLMVGLVVGTPKLGLVIASGIVFALFSIVVTAPRPWLSLIVAIILPVVLYFFFEHVAGVAIPQGRFISLP